MLLYLLSFSNACIAPIIQSLFPLVIGTSSLVYSDAPTSSTASTRSVTFGSTFIPVGSTFTNRIICSWDKVKVNVKILELELKN